MFAKIQVQRWCRVSLQNITIFFTMFAGVVQAQVDQVVGEVPAAGGGLRGSVGEQPPLMDMRALMG